MRGQFRTPSLRNVAVTAPYMHDGRHERLRDAIRHVVEPAGPAGPRPAVMTIQQVSDLGAFLATLTDQDGERRPWVAESVLRCP